jgi:phosphocarrier protein HPr
MVSFEYQITDPEGLHARPAGLLVKSAQACSSEVTVSLNGKNVNAKRIFAIMGLGAKQNDVMTISVEGDKEQTDCADLKAFCEENL